MTTDRLARNVRRIRRKLLGLRCRAHCSRQADPLTTRDGLIVTTCYDVEGDYARPGATPAEIDCVGRILEIEKRYGIRSTYNVVARFALDAPHVVAAIQRAGAELASHSYDHSILTTLGRSAIRDDLERTQRTFGDLGVTIRGHRSPQSEWDFRVLDALVGGGFDWNAENGPEPYPYRVRRRGGKTLWRFPISGDDWQYESARVPPETMLNRWRKQVQEARGRRKYLAIGFHPWVEAAPGRLTVLEEFFHWLAEQDGVQVMPFGEVLRIAAGSTAPQLAAAHG